MTARGKDAGARRKKIVKNGKTRSRLHSRWLERQLNDPYVARAKREGMRSRAAYKLIEIDDKSRLLKPGARVVDLGAAPGGWSQVAAKRVGAPRAGQGGRHRRSCDGADAGSRVSSNSISSIRRRPTRSRKCSAGRRCRALRHGGQCDRPREDRSPQDHGAGRGCAPNSRARCCAGRHLSDQGAAGGTEAALLAALKRDYHKRETCEAAGKPRGFGRAVFAGHRISWRH